ncbi:MAG: hypothetical protein OEV40_16680 [Acidimicrobiia bacterium]|nr:hypothetical protein [Acidimicrobiia bacterium]
MLLTISSVRGSPGVTSWALLLAAAWPPGAPDERVVLEADCAGGVLGARYQLGVEPGAVSLVSACRRADDTLTLDHHGRLVADGLWVVPGPEVAERAVPVWTSGATDVAGVLRKDDRLWLADVGRAGPESPVQDLIRSSVANVVVSGPSIEDVVQVPARVAALSASAPTGVVVVGRCDFAEDELHRFFGGRALWAVPTADRLPELAMRAVQGGRARRSASWRAATEVASDLALLCRGGRRPVSGLSAHGVQGAEREARSGPDPADPPVAIRPLPTRSEDPERAAATPDSSADDDRAAELSPAMQAALDHRRRGRAR